MKTSVPVSAIKSMGRFVFLIALYACHFTESKRQIVIEIQNAVDGKAEGPGYKQVYTAPETIDPLNDSDTQSAKPTTDRW